MACTIRNSAKAWYNQRMSKQPARVGQQVGINAHLLSHQASYRSAGVHGYIHNLIRNLPAVTAAQEFDFTVYVGRGEIEPHERIRAQRSRWPTGRPPLRILWEQLVLPWQRMDLLHSMAFVTPLILPWPAVVTVYDLSFVHYPETFTGGRRAYLKLFTRLSCRRAQRIIAISESTRRDIVQQWGIPAAKISVAYPGVGGEFACLPADQVAAFRQRRQLPDPFILHVGTLQPRKNLVRLVRAVGRLRDGGLDATLVLAGGPGWLYSEILKEIERLNLQQSVLLPGYVPADELVEWYNAAAVLAYPSLYEGFGLPVVEAMACGTPVVTTSASSMPEAAGDATLQVDPHDTEALAEALRRVLTDQSLRNELRQRGVAQAARFTWRETAAATADVYRQVLREFHD
jgi:glycosyltransferase involved in cell wall biosynthesis